MMNEGTLSADTLQDLLNIFGKNINDFLDKNYHPDYELFYRGQSDVDWPPMSALMREEYHTKNNGKAGLYVFEDDMIKHVMKHFPNEFTDLLPFQTLSKLQHYGLPTRLLDITRNLFIAAYFACHDDNKEKINANGAIYLFYGKPLQPDNDLVKKFSALCFVQADAPTYGQSFIINPDYDNPRIKAQEGAFILERDPNEVKKLLVDIKIVIPSKRKKYILSQLNLIGINYQSLFPELSSMTRAAKDLYIQKIFDEIENVTLTATVNGVAGG